MARANTTTMFTSNLDNLSNPQASYLYKVTFDGADITGIADNLVEINNNDDAVSMTATLPKATVKTVTQWYKGTPKTRIVNQDRSGDTNLTFIIRREGLGKLANLFNLKGFNLDDLPIDGFYHEEFYRSFNKLHIYLLKSNGYRPRYILNSNNVNAEFTLFNCVVTSLDFGEVSYEDSQMVKLNVTIHYDYWSADSE